MNEIKFTGGARIGSSSATYPFGSLRVNGGRLDLSAGLFGNVSFLRTDIRSIQLYEGFFQKES